LHVWSIIFLVIAINLDNLWVGIAYGLKKVKISFTSNLVIALLSGLAILLSIVVGKSLLLIIPQNISNILGGGIVFIIGFWTIISFNENTAPIESLNEVMNEPYAADSDNSGDISIREAIILGTALAVNCLTAGFGAGISGIGLAAITGASMLFSIVSISLGNYLGIHHINLGNKGNIIAGILLCITGIYEMFI
jgi:putative sporulation protein YtaF